MKDNRLVIFTINDVYFDQRVQKIASTLQNSGHDVVWIARAKHSRKKKLIFNFGVKRWTFLVNSGPLFYAVYAFRQFFYLLSNPEIKKVYCCDADTLLGAWFCSKFRNLFIIYDAHEYFIETPELSKKSLKKKIWHWIEYKGVLGSQKRITVADHLAYQLSVIYGMPFEVIRNLPIYTNDYLPLERDNIIIYQGVLNVGRGLELAIDAMEFLPDYQLWICGEGDLEAELKVRAEKFSNISFFGYLNPEELKVMTKKVKFGLNLLDLESKNYYFSLANKFFDYAASGVVSINSCGIEYMDYNNRYNHCLLFEGKTPEDLVELIRSTDIELYESLQLKGLKMMKEHHWENEASKLVEIVYTEPCI